MKIFTDPNQIKYRTALQVDRDYQVADLGVAMDELRVQFQTKNAKGMPPITPQDKQYVMEKVRLVANPHLELQFDEMWTKQPQAFKNKVIEKTANALLRIAFQAPEPIEYYIRTTGPVILEEIFKAELGAVSEVAGLNIANPPAQPISYNLPFQPKQPAPATPPPYLPPKNPKVAEPQPSQPQSPPPQPPTNLPPANP